jgi:hypothetical protein
MNVVMIIPTGIGCEIGGHCGDGNAAARLLGACCDTLILHPNVVNASDLNEMPPNSLYVEGSQLDRFLKAENYLEAAGVLMAMQAGVQPAAVRRPLLPTVVK